MKAGEIYERQGPSRSVINQVPRPPGAPSYLLYDVVGDLWVLVRADRGEKPTRAFVLVRTRSIAPDQVAIVSVEAEEEIKLGGFDTARAWLRGRARILSQEVTP